MKFSAFVLLLAGCQVLTDGALPSIAQTLAPSKPSETTLGSRLVERSKQVSLSSSVASEDRVRIETKTATFIRGKKGQEYPNYKEAIVKYPQVTGLNDQTVLRNVQSAVSLKSVFGQSLAELRTEFLESWWLSAIDYTVNYNQHSLLDLTFTISGVGAYPSSYDKHRTIDLKTGKVLKAADVFKRESLGAIAVLVNKAMQTEVKQAIAKGDQDGVDLRDRLNKQRFQIKNLDGFLISDKGITFFYDFGLPHVMLALAPSGKYFLSYDHLKTGIKPEGGLGVFLPKATIGIRG